MRIELLFWRGHAALLILVGRTPSIPLQERKLLMALDKLQALVDDTRAAAGRLLVQAQSDASALATANQTIAGFEDQAVALVQPLHDEIVSAAPPALPVAAPNVASADAPTE